MSRKLAIGFITYNDLTAKYLPYFLPSLENQTFKDYRILAIDNSKAENNKNAAYMKNNFPEIKFEWARENLGFARAFNRMIQQSIESGADYFMPLNPDMVFEPDWLEQLVKIIKNNNQCGAVQSKILKWDFKKNRKTDQADSLGLSVNSEHRFSDIHQIKSGENKPEEPSEVFGFTGTAVLLSLKAISDVAFVNGAREEYFDELMFMYKEDCDLSYRLRLAGWKIFLAPRAVAYHDRSVAPKGESNLKIALNRLSKSRDVKRWSFLNHWILWLKYKNLPFSFKVRMATWRYQIKSLIFVVLFEQYLLKELIKLWRLGDKIRERRGQLKIRVNIKEIERFMD